MFTFAASIKLLGVSQSLAIRDHLGIKPLRWRLIGVALLSIGAIAFHVRASDSAKDTAGAVIGLALAIATAVLHAI